MDLLDPNVYGPRKNKGFRYSLVVIDNFTKLGLTVPLKKKTSQKRKDSLGNILNSSKRKPNSI